MECTRCGGHGCQECDVGRIEITGCPLELITPDIWELLELAELYKKGLPPVDGGVLDQAADFVTACRFVWSEENIHKKRLGID
jgi:hypothetical protein